MPGETLVKWLLVVSISTGLAISLWLYEVEEIVKTVNIEPKIESTEVVSVKFDPPLKKRKKPVMQIKYKTKGEFLSHKPKGEVYSFLKEEQKHPESWETTYHCK